MSNHNYNAWESFANLTRQDSREDRLNTSPRSLNSGVQQQTGPQPNYIQHTLNVNHFKTVMPPFLKKLMEAVTLKYSKIACSIQNLKLKQENFTQIMTGQGLPPEFRFQQKYFDSLKSPALKEAFVLNLMANKKEELKTKIVDLTTKYDARYDDLESQITKFEQSGSDFLKDSKIPFKDILNSFIQIQICTMTAKSTQDYNKKLEKQQKFNETKESKSKPKILTVGDYEKLTAQIKSLKIKNNSSKSKKKSKNLKGEKTGGKSQSPKKTQDKKKDQAKRKTSPKQKGNGNTRNTATKQR